MSRVPRAARVLLLTGFALLLVLPGAIAPAPTLTPGQIQITNGGFAGDAVNFTDLYTYNETVGGRLWIGNLTASYLEATTAGRIDTNSTLNTTLAAPTDAAEQSRVPTDSVVRFVRDAAGKMQWGPGNGALDTNLYRGGADTLTTDAYLQKSGEAGDFAYGTFVPGDTGDARWAVKINGEMRWGEGGATGYDTNLYRSGVGTLKTDGAFHVAGGFYAAGGLRIPVSTHVTGESPYTAAAAESVILYNDINGDSTVNLPTCSGISGKLYTIKKIGSNGGGAHSVTIDASGSETIDGAATKVLSNQYQGVTIVCDGSNWHITAEVG